MAPCGFIAGVAVVSRVLKMIALLVRKEGMTHEEFVDHYNETHKEFGKSLPHVQQYSTAVPLEAPGRIKHNLGGSREASDLRLMEYDGVSTFHFDSYDDYMKMVESDEYEVALDDELNLIDDIYFLLVDEEVHIDHVHDGGDEDTMAVD